MRPSGDPAAARGDDELTRSSPRTLSVTFDNLGEAADLELGMWPEGRPRGEHLSVVEVLPRVLEVLDRLDIRATFFVEGVNAEAYPEALRAIADAGHELALHAWRHEEWGNLAPAREAELLERGTQALAGLGHRPRGFRPPGGQLTPQTAELLRAHGYTYASPHGDRAAKVDGLALLPFRWEMVDAYFHFPGQLRAQLTGDREADPPSLPPSVKGALFHAAIRLGSLTGARRLRKTMLEALANPHGHVVLVFHPFLLRWRRTMDAMTDVLEEAKTSGLRVAPMHEVAEHVD